MKETNVINRTIPLLLTTLILFGCGSGGGSDSASTNVVSETENINENITAPATYTGVFVDAPVQGLRYQTNSQSGVTNSQGEFIYQLGESITFSIGNINFPETAANNQVTPLDIFNTSDVNNVGVSNMLRLLQTLDVDGIPENGIELQENIHELASSLTIDFTSDDFDTNVAELLVNNNAINISLISVESAIQHFTSQLNPSSSSCGNEHQKVGITASFNSLAHGVSGNAEVIDNCTISITNFNYDATAPAVYFYATNANSNPFTIGNELRNNGEDYQNDTIILTLPNNSSLDDIDSLSVWCVDFKVSFGDLELSNM